MSIQGILGYNPSTYGQSLAAPGRNAANLLQNFAGYGGSGLDALLNYAQQMPCGDASAQRLVQSLLEMHQLSTAAQQMDALGSGATGCLPQLPSAAGCNTPPAVCSAPGGTAFGPENVNCQLAKFNELIAGAKKGDNYTAPDVGRAISAMNQYIGTIKDPKDRAAFEAMRDAFAASYQGEHFGEKDRQRLDEALRKLTSEAGNAPGLTH